MSKAIRIREHLYDEIAKRAGEERRSIIGQLEYLLEQALRIDVDAQPRDVEARRVSGGAVQATHPPAASSEERSDSGVGTANAPDEAVRPHITAKDPGPESSDPHFKPDPK